MRRLRKRESQQRFHELRDLWNDYDPIGVYRRDWPDDLLRDEYDSYVKGTMRLLEQDAREHELLRYLRKSVAGSIGLQFDEAEAETFARRLKAWFKENWDKTYG